MAGEVTLSCKLSKNYLLTPSETQKLHLVIDIIPQGGASSYAQLPLNISLVLDRSGSMYEPNSANDKTLKLDYVQRAAKYIVDNLQTQDIVSLVVFADEAIPVASSQQITNKAAIQEQIDKIEYANVGNGTDLLKGITAGINEIKKNQSHGVVNRLLLLTDGKTKEGHPESVINQNEESCRSLAHREGDSGISFTAIGIGEQYNHELLRDVSGTHFHHLTTADMIQGIFESELRGLQSVFAVNLNMQVKFIAGISILKAFRARPVVLDLANDINLTERTVNARIDALQKGEIQTVLLELAVPQRQVGTYRIAQVSLGYDIPSLNIYKATTSHDVVLSFTQDVALSEQVDPAVNALVDEVLGVYLPWQAAQKALKAGNISVATRLLENAAATSVLVYGNAGNQTTVLVEALQELKGTKKLSSGMTKQLEYKVGQTKKLSLP